nr:hypothetical protein CFP56_37336 [Quercus suber]
MKHHFISTNSRRSRRWKTYLPPSEDQEQIENEDKPLLINLSIGRLHDLDVSCCRSAVVPPKKDASALGTR